jgi:transposase
LTKRQRNKLIYERHKEGYSQQEIGKFYGLSQSAVSLIIISARKGNLENQEEKRGAKSRLTDGELEDLKGILDSEQSEAGFSGWNKWSVKALIHREFGVDYHENYIWKIMEKIGYTSQLPSKKDYRQDARKVKQFKEHKVAEIKKK